MQTMSDEPAAILPLLVQQELVWLTDTHRAERATIAGGRNSEFVTLFVALTCYAVLMPQTAPDSQVYTHLATCALSDLHLHPTRIIDLIEQLRQRVSQRLLSSSVTAEQRLRLNRIVGHQCMLVRLKLAQSGLPTL